MADDRPLKSAYELAMERLRRQDRERGEEPERPLSDAQKREIAKLRQQAKASIAELEIMQRKRLAEAAGDLDRIAEAEERFRIDRARIESTLESKIARIKRGETPAAGS